MASTIQPAVKVTVQSQRAGDTAKHNDRTMYKHGYFNDLAPDDSIPNFHWTREKFGIDSDEMEHLMYESLYMDKIKQRNETYAANYQWSKVFDLEDEDERAKAVDDFRWKHPPRETIFQVGSMENPIDRDVAKKILMERGEKMVEQQSDNFIVLSYDIHMDEGSPHMHVRYLMLDEEGMPNAEGALKEMGVEPPVPYEQWAQEEDERRQARAEKNPDYEYRPAKAASSARNNRLVTFTRDMREDFENQVESAGIAIDTTRTRKRHLTQAQERTKRETEAALKQLDEALRKQQEEALQSLESNARQIRELNDAVIKARADELKQKVNDGDEETKKRLQYNSLKSRHETLLKGLKSRDEQELGPIYDDEGEEINDEWFTTSYAEVQAANFRESKKDKIRRALEALDAAINEPEEPTIDVNTLEKLQDNYNQAEEARQQAAKLAEQRQSQRQATTQANKQNKDDDEKNKDDDGQFGD